MNKKNEEAEQAIIQALDNGIKFSEAGKYDQAIKEFSSAIALTPEEISFNKNLARAYMNRGNAYNALNQHQEALEDYDKAIELAPNYAAAYK